MGKYFGTDGFRGKANVDLTADHAYKIGRFLGWYLGEKKRRQGDSEKAKVVIGKDTRRSSYMLEYSLAGGLVASGADAYLLHVTTTPSVAYITICDSFDCGIMISASHNPYYDNGIKLIGAKGEKSDEKTTGLIEAFLDGEAVVFGEKICDVPFATGENIGRTFDFFSGRNRYIGYLISLCSHCFKGIRVGLDCSNGSTWNIARSVFDALGAKTYVTAAEPDGTNINRDCGSTHTRNLQKLVMEKELDVGFAFDGDGDRCICVSEKGEIVDGDSILYISGKYLKENGKLKDDTVVTTVMSNFGLYKAFQKLGIRTEKTAVGDRFVHECMCKGGYVLGGEQSGHIIFSKYATTGDGILTSLMVMEVMLQKKQSLSELCSGFTRYPQHLVNVQVKDKCAVMNCPEISEVCKKAEKELGANGRLLLRESGTEPVIRIMIECESQEKCERLCESIAKAIKDFQL